jgi:predicted AlkP superfamily pyrophosphatase or phosphodiesterase
MIKRNFIYLLILIIGVLNFSSCKSSSNITESSLTRNSKTSFKKPYVILISLDGFRWDYVEKYKPPHLTNFIKNGIKAESLVPSFPSKTFPNHYTLVTGMYPDKHGILGNTFYSYDKDVKYDYKNEEMVEDGTFYGGSPIWVQADKASMVSASYFFVASEAKIQDIRPTYYQHYDGSVKNEVRIAQTLNWLKLPAIKRPHIITLYFSDMDNVGHKFGPNNDDEIKQALFNLDQNLGNLFKGVQASELPVNIIIVSDHGMTDVPMSNFIAIEDIKNDSLYSFVNNGTIVNIHPKKDAEIDSIIQYIKQKENHFKVYKTADTPGFEYVPQNKDWGAIQVLPDFAYCFLPYKRIETMKKDSIINIGLHGYDPKYKDMHGIFYASGPAFKKDFVTASIKNIHIYPLMCHILGLEIPNDIDGDLNEIKSVLKTD